MEDNNHSLKAGLKESDSNKYPALYFTSIYTIMLETY
ncbi:hypothetical protein ABID39_001460 [Bartonella japonica]|uniref:Uncharacterized protein n=1 Tax=Bartonella japonica TaxID=357761 RepID=A0ABV2FQE8_9HYPH